MEQASTEQHQDSGSDAGSVCHSEASLASAQSALPAPSREEELFHELGDEPDIVAHAVCTIPAEAPEKTPQTLVRKKTQAGQSQKRSRGKASSIPASKRITRVAQQINEDRKKEDTVMAGTRPTTSSYKDVLKNHQVHQKGTVDHRSHALSANKGSDKDLLRKDQVRSAHMLRPRTASRQPPPTEPMSRTFTRMHQSVEPIQTHGALGTTWEPYLRPTSASSTAPAAPKLLLSSYKDAKPSNPRKSHLKHQGTSTSSNGDCRTRSQGIELPIFPLPKQLQDTLSGPPKCSEEKEHPNSGLDESVMMKSLVLRNRKTLQRVAINRLRNTPKPLSKLDNFKGKAKSRLTH